MELEQAIKNIESAIPAVRINGTLGEASEIGKMLQESIATIKSALPKSQEPAASK